MPEYTPKFTVTMYHDVAPYLAGITATEFFTDADKLIRAWKLATQWQLDTFHGRLAPRVPSAAPNAYGHLVCLGAPLQYSAEGEPNVTPATDSLEDGIRRLEAAQGMDFTACPLFRQYAETSARVREVFPDAPVLGGLSWEGPVTSAALYLGQTFFMDAIEEPERVAYFMRLMTDSIIAFKRQQNVFCGLPEVDPNGARIYDDLASLLPPAMWEEMVVPYWRQYYAGLTSGPRHFLHCESTIAGHLPYIPRAGVTFYQPSVSPKLTLADMQTLGLPFDWLLYAFHITDMDDRQIADWVRAAVDARAADIRTQYGAYAIREGRIDRILAFLDVADSYRTA